MVTSSPPASTSSQGMPEMPFRQPSQAQQEPYRQPHNKKHGWIVAVVLVALLAFIVFGVNSCTKALFGDKDGSVAHESGTVALIEISGTIDYDGSACSPEGLKHLLDQAQDDDDIAAVVLRVNSGGGTAAAGEEMAHYVREFSKPIVVSSAGINASAAYEISSQADYIFAAKSTELGSIGTAMQLIDYSQLLNLLGIKMTDIVSSPGKDSSYGNRALTDEEKAYYQDIVDEINEVFIDNVCAGRNMSRQEVEPLATGMIFTGVQAVENGLIDRIGTLEDAEKKAAELAGVDTENIPVVSLKLKTGEFATLIDFMSASNDSGRISIDQLVRALKELNHDERIVQ